MDVSTLKDKHVFESMLIILIVGMTGLFHVLGEHGLLALYLFFLPVILCGYFLGRMSAGVLALFSVLIVTIASTVYAPRFQGYDTPVMIGLAIAMWAAALGLTAILMGTLCDERARTVNELHRAYVGVVDVLFKYLQASNPHTKARSMKVAELSEATARQMHLSRKEADDIRVAALLRELENVEVTTQMISRAMNTLEASPAHPANRFLGTDLVHSLGSVLESALPLIAIQDDELRDCLADRRSDGACHPVGAEILSAVRLFIKLTNEQSPSPISTPQAINALRDEGISAAVVDAIARSVNGRQETETTTDGRLEMAQR